MDINRIKHDGYFDNVLVDGFMMPLYNVRGIVIPDDKGNVISGLDATKTKVSQGVSKVCIKILGESDNTELPSEVSRMREHRYQLGLKRIGYGCRDRYYIAEVNLLILRDGSHLADGIINEGKSLVDFKKSFKNETTLQLLETAYKLQKAKTLFKGEPTKNVGVVDTVLVHKAFRRCGISTWIHENIGDLIKIFGLVDVQAVVLIPGDFTNAAAELEMSEKQYKDMLVQHYKKVGYNIIDRSTSTMKKVIVKKEVK